MVIMEKDGEHLEVHDSCVSSHKEAGWKIAESQEKPQRGGEVDEDAQTAEPEQKRRGRPAKAE